MANTKKVLEEDVTKVPQAKTAEDVNAPVYNLAGQQVSKDSKGVLIQNGRKFVNK